MKKKNEFLKGVFFFLTVWDPKSYFHASKGKRLQESKKSCCGSCRNVCSRSPKKWGKKHEVAVSSLQVQGRTSSQRWITQVSAQMFSHQTYDYSRNSFCIKKHASHANTTAFSCNKRHLWWGSCFRPRSSYCYWKYYWKPRKSRTCFWWNCGCPSFSWFYSVFSVITLMPLFGLFWQSKH